MRQLAEVVYGGRGGKGDLLRIQLNKPGKENPRKPVGQDRKFGMVRFRRRGRTGKAANSLLHGEVQPQDRKSVV